MKELTMPHFLIAENPTEDKNRFVYIYSPVYLSFILIVDENSTTLLLNEEMRKKPKKTFNYQDESFELVILQNNIEMTGGQLAPKISTDEFLDLAWKFWENYLIWEDGNIDDSEKLNLN